MAKKQPPRKSKKRQPPKQRIDDDLTLLAEVLDEHRLDTNVDGWFTMPWRDGWRAVELGLAMALCYNDIQAGVDLQVVDFIRNAVVNRNSSPELYWQSAEIIQLCNLIQDRNTHAFLYASLRCFQVLSSNSSGGGEVYNYLLKRALNTTSEPWSSLEDLVMKFRCYDALGLDEKMAKHDFFAKSVKAFEIAWKRGLFHAAYAIAPAKRITIQTSMWTHGDPLTISSFSKAESRK